MNVGRNVYRFRWAIVAAWVAMAALAFAIPSVNPASTERDTFLPEHAPYVRAIRAMVEAFPANSSLSEVVVVFERRDGALGEQDLGFINGVADRFSRPDPSGKAAAEDLEGVTVQVPGSLTVPVGLSMPSREVLPSVGWKTPLMNIQLPSIHLNLPELKTVTVRNPRISPVTATGQAMLVRVCVPHYFLGVRAYRIVEHVRAILADRQFPPGLTAAISGSSGFGHDYAQAADNSYQRSSYVTVVAVIVILLLVYRAPLAAMIPLGAISLATVVVLTVLGVAQLLNMHIGTAERIFVFVLLYGAGTDYSLLLISRYREMLAEGTPALPAVTGALDATFPTVLASAFTNAAGLFMMTFADFSIFRTTGPAVAIAILVALLASTTLVPAMMGILGPRQFWPSRWCPKAPVQQAAPESSPGPRPEPGGLFDRKKPRGFWPRLARLVALRPGLVLVVTLGALAPPVLRSVGLTWVYDTLTGIKESFPQGIGNASAGVEIAKRHWPVGEIAPLSLLVRSAKPASADQWQAASAQIASAVGRIGGVRDVRGLTQPLGRFVPLPEGWQGIPPARQMARAEYASGDRAIRLSVVLDHPPFSLEAMSVAQNVQRTAIEALAQTGMEAEVMMAGATAEMMDVRKVTQRDFYLIAPLALGAIFLIVLILLRDALLTAFMVICTVLGYMATLGLTHWAFQAIGTGGLDWKVEVLLFIVMVAVGVDYSIFLAARIKQEASRWPMVEATRRAVIHTGPVISSCGVIMAATLGSLMAGDLKLLLQLGFAFSLGMLLDTFMVRPLLLPAFAVLVRPRRKAAQEDARAP